MKLSAGFKFAADNKKDGLTLADLYEFIQSCDEVNIDPRTPVKVGVGFRGQIITIEPRITTTQAEGQCGTKDPA